MRALLLGKGIQPLLFELFPSLPLLIFSVPGVGSRVGILLTSNLEAGQPEQGSGTEVF